MDQEKISKASEDWKKDVKKARHISSMAAGNASTISYSNSSNSHSMSQPYVPDGVEVAPSSPPPDIPEEINLKKYLENYIDGYLIGDLETLIRNVSKDKGEKFNCSFVIILTICAGIEFLGLLLNPKNKVDNEETTDRNRSCFSYYWNNYLDDKYKNAINGGDAYNLIRNGLAHCFMVKHGIGTIRFRPNEHLDIDLKDNQKVLKIDADTFFEDFNKSYGVAKKKLLDGNKGEQLATKRLCVQLENYKNDSEGFFNQLNKNNTQANSTGSTTMLDIASIS